MTVTIKEYLKQIQADPFIKTTDKDTEGEIVMSDHFQTNFIDHMRFNYGKLLINDVVTEDFDNINDVRDEVRALCSNLYKTNSYKYNTLWGSMNEEYDPIENYKMTETTIQATSKSSQGSNTIGAQSNSRTQGAQSNSTVQGAQTNNKTQGAQSNSVQYGATSKSSTIGAQTNSTQFGATTQTNQYGSESDSIQYGSTLETTQKGTAKVTTVTGATLETDTKAQLQTQKTSADTHGESPYDIVGEFGGRGSSGAGTSGDASFQMKSRDIHESIEAVGQHVDTVGVAEHTDTVTTDAITDTVGMATHTDTTSKGAHTDTIGNATHTDTFTLGGRSDSESETQHTDTTSVGQRQDSETIGQRQDSETIGQRQDSESLGQRQDSSTGSETGSFSQTLTRSGNIGVTTSQQMIQSEREVALINLYEIVAHDLIKKLCCLVY